MDRLIALQAIYLKGVEQFPTELLSEEFSGKYLTMLAKGKEIPNAFWIENRANLGTIPKASTKRSFVYNKGLGGGEQLSPGKVNKLATAARKEKARRNNTRVVALGMACNEVRRVKKSPGSQLPGTHRFLIKNQTVGFLATLGKVAALGGFCSVARLKAALELANNVLDRTNLDIDGSEPSLAKDREQVWKRPEGLVKLLKEGWELGCKCDVKIADHTRALKRNGLGAAFTAFE